MNRDKTGEEENGLGTFIFLGGGQLMHQMHKIHLFTHDMRNINSSSWNIIRVIAILFAFSMESEKQSMDIIYFRT